MNYILRQLLPSGSKDNPIEIHLTEDEVYIGRRTKVILSKFPQISRDHAIFYKSDSGTFFVKDKSRNGIFINDVKIGQSLKSLSIGDVIGFGVPSSLNAEGFVCTLCSDASYKVKHEVIDISDDDDPPQVDVKSSLTSDTPESVKDDSGSSKFFVPNVLAACSSNSSLPPHQISGPNSKDSPITNFESVSKSSNINDVMIRTECDTSNVPSAAYLPSNCVLSVCKSSTSAIKSVSNSNDDAVKNSQILNMPLTSKQEATARKSVSSLKRSSDSYDTSLTNDNVKSRKISVTMSVPKSQNLTSVSYGKNAKVLESSSKILLSKATQQEQYKTTRSCVVELIKCDSKYFPWPDDVKSPFSKSHDTSSTRNNHRHKEVTISKSKCIDSKPCSSKRFCSSGEHNSTKKYASESEPDNVISYSQVEEIIYISDDDEYLDFKSSQDYVHVKEEPEDHDEIDAGEEDELDALSAVNNMDSFTFINKKNINEEKTTASVSAFVEKTQVDRIEIQESDHDSDAKTEKNKYATSHPHTFDSDDSDEENNCRKNFHEESNQNFLKEKWTVVENIKSKLKNSGKVQIIDAKPLDYRPRYMRGRDERVVERPKSVPIPAKKPKVSPKKQSAKEQFEKCLPRSNLKNYKIPRKVSIVNTDSSAKKTEQDQKKDSVLKKPSFAKKAPSVKTRPDKFASRMQFLTEELPVNPRKITPAKNSINKSVDNAAKIKQSSSVQKSMITSKIDQESNKSTLQNILPTSVSFNKPVAPQKSCEDLHNPRDPRQNRQPAPSSERLKPYSGAAIQTPITPVLIPVPKLSQLPNNYDIRPSQTVLPFNTQDKRLFYNHPKNVTSFELRNRLVKEILKLNTKWLEEQNNMKHPPDPVCEGAHNLPLKFDSFQSYVSAFYPMIRLELWEQMYTESKEVFESNKRYKKFYFSVLSYTSKDDYIELECESVVSECYGPQEGSIVILEMKENMHKCSPMFGYIDKCRKSKLDLKKLKYQGWEKLFEKCGIKDKLNAAKHWTFLAHIKRKEISFELGSLMKGNGLCYIRHKLRLVDALTFLEHSSLLDDFLQPKLETFLVNCNPLCPEKEISGQIKFINDVSAEICKPMEKPKIILLQKRLSTDKIHTIIGLVNKLLVNNNYQPGFKILVTAPSNAAIDEIACCLIAFINAGKFEKQIKFTRIGIEEKVHPNVKQYLLENMVRSSPGPVSDQNDRKLQNLQAEINRFQNQMPSKQRNEKLNCLQEQYNYIMKSASTYKNNYHSNMTRKQNILRDSHIIFSTLSCCTTLSTLLNTQFSFCVIDESTKCTELEILQPLMLGVRKLLLVGDLKQPPATVLSKLAYEYGYERSAFKRFHSYFEKYCEKIPVFTFS